MNTKIVINNQKPIVSQIVEHIRREIASGRIDVGHIVPTVRTLADENGIAPMTVSKAIKVLRAEGVLAIGAAKRIFVSAVDSSQAAKLTLIQDELRELVEAADQMGVSNDLLLRFCKDYLMGESSHEPSEKADSCKN